jgi:hypothetical protein
MNSHLRTSFIGLLLTALLLTGCTVGNTGLNVNISDGQLTATVSIGQDALNRLIDRAGETVKVEGDDFVEEIRGVDFVEPDTIRVDGVYRLPQGGTTAGMIDFGVEAAQGAIRLAVTDVDADGLSLDTPIIRELNDELAAEFAQEVRSQQGDGDGVSDVTVTNSALMITVSASIGE